MSSLQANDQLRLLLGGDPTRPQPFPETSRYYSVETATLTTDDGREVVYLLRRFVPQPGRFATVKEHMFIQGDRLDNLAALYLRDPEQFWLLCDANGALRPEELEAVGRRLRITLPADVPEAPRA